MNSSVWHDRGLQRTNPVHVLDYVVRQLDSRYCNDMPGAARILADVLARLTAEGVHLPVFAIESLKQNGWIPQDVQFESPPRPGVLGLVVHPETDLGLVLPLRACEREPNAEGWDVDSLLPFQAEAVLDLLAGLVQSAGLPGAGLLPERLAFSFANPLGYRTYGNSMTVAAALAVLDVLGGGESPLFRCACAVVEPGEGGLLRPVRHMGPKLRAAFREHGKVSLLIAPAECAGLDEFRGRTEVVWEVADLGDLARRLDRAGALAPLLRKTPLRRAELQRVHDRLLSLVRAGRSAEAGELGGRVEGCATAEAVPVRLWDGIRGLVAAAARHQGRFVEAIERSGKIHAAVLGRGRFTSHDEQADAAAEHAAALFDLHDFERIPRLLSELAPAAREDSLTLRPQTRVKVLNTLGRVLVILERNGWEECFRHSRELQEKVDPAEVPRTLSYHIHGLLRSNRLDEAHALLEGLPPGSPWLCFLWAEWARRSGKVWRDGGMDAARPDRCHPGHPYAFYCQAVARQEGCADAPELLGRAAAFLRADAAGQPRNICSFFASCVELLAAARAGDRAAWDDSAEAVRRFLEDPAAVPLRLHYQPALAACDTPSLAATEELLRLNPYL